MANYKEEELLKSLALALVDNPRGTTKDLAEAAGISKATLHRFCKTRENLENMLAEKAIEAFQIILDAAQEKSEDYREGLNKLIAVHYKYYEYIHYIFTFQPSNADVMWDDYSKAIDIFFLEGQKQGVFRIEFNVGFLSEIFISGICGVTDAMRRGRVAKVGMAELFEEFFLNGVLHQA